MTTLRSQNIKVYLVDDDASISDAISMSLRQRGFQVENYHSAIHFLKDYQPCGAGYVGCLVLDKSMPVMSGLELQGELSIRGISLPVVLITGDGTISDAVKALKAGASDVLEKPFMPEVLWQSIFAAVQEFARLKEKIGRAGEISEKLSRLTAREQDVLEQLLESDDEVPSNKVIARALEISHRTVEHHRASIMMKTGVASIYELKSLMESAESHL